MARIMVRRAAVLLGGTALAIAGTSAAGAQNAPAAAEPAVTQSGLEDIVVTAQRRSERLQDVPIAVTAISGDAATKQGVRNVDDVQTATPALTVTRVNQTPLFYLRGVGTQNQLPNEEPSIPLYIDGFYASTGAGSALSLNNIARVEVLRGPQGTLFGRNGTGGLINIVTKTPSHDTQGTVSVGYGNYNTVDGSLYATTGLNEKIAADVAVQYTHRGDGFGHNLNLGNEVGVDREFSAHSKWLLEPTDRTTITISGEYSNIRTDLGMTTHLFPGVVGYDGRTTAGGQQDITTDLNPIAKAKTYAIMGRIDQDVNFANLVSLTQWRDNKTYYQKDVDGIPDPRSTARQDEYTRYFTQELQLVSQPGSKLQWVVGGFYLNGDGGVDPLLVGGTQFAPLGVNYQIRHGNVKSESYAGFAQATYEIVSRLRLTLGGRYTHDKKILTGDITNVLFSGATAVSVPPTRNQLSSNKFTYRVALDYKAMDNVLVYGVVSRGYKAGSFNVLSPTDPAIQPETLDAVEGGIKSELFDRKVRLNLAGYHYDYKNIQLSQLCPTTIMGCAGIKILNASSAKIWGLELESVFNPVKPLTLSANMAYTHGRYGDFPGAPFSFRAPYNCTTGVIPGGSTIGRNVQCTGNAKGNKVVRTPSFTSTVTANYDIPIGSNTLSLNGSWYYNDGFYWEVDNRVRQPAYSLFNADVRYRFADRYTVRGWVRNVANKKYAIGVSTSSQDQIAPGAPRTFGGTLMVDF